MYVSFVPHFRWKKVYGDLSIANDNHQNIERKILYAEVWSLFFQIDIS